MKPLEIYQQLLQDMKFTDSEAELDELSEQASVAMSESEATLEDKANALAVLLAVVSNDVAKMGYDLERAKADPSFDATEMEAEHAKYKSYLEILQPEFVRLQQLVRVQADKNEGVPNE